MAAWRGVAPLASVAVSDELIENCVLDGRCDRRAQKSTVRHERESRRKSRGAVRSPLVRRRRALRERFRLDIQRRQLPAGTGRSVSPKPVVNRRSTRIPIGRYFYFQLAGTKPFN